MFGFIITKKKLLNILLVFVLGVTLLCLIVFKVSDNKNVVALQPATDTLERVAFIENLGYTVNRETPEESKNIQIPYVFNDIYNQYQEIQQKAGYDLTKYSGNNATLYTYSLIYKNRTDVYAHLLVVDEKVIGGDISALSVEDGFINPLTPIN